MLKAYYLDRKSNKVYGVKVSTLELSRKENEDENNLFAWEIRRIEFESVDGSIRCVNISNNDYQITNILDVNGCCNLYRDKECTQRIIHFAMSVYGNYSKLGKFGYRCEYNDDKAQIGFSECLNAFLRSKKDNISLRKERDDNSFYSLHSYFRYYVVYGGEIEPEQSEVIYDAVNNEIIFTPNICYKDRKVDGIFANTALANEFIQSQREVIDFEEEETPNETKKKELQSKLTELQKEIENIKTEISLLA